MKINVIAQYHPAAALHQPRLWSTMLDDWAHFPEKVDADYTIQVYGSQPLANTVALDTECGLDGGLGQWSVAYRDISKALVVSPFYGSRPSICFGQQVIMHNAKWDIRVLQGAKMPVPENIVDTMIAAYCMGLGKQDVSQDARFTDTGMIGGLGLKYLARRHLGMTMRTWQEVESEPDAIPEYNAKDSVATYLLWEKWKDDLPQHFWDIDMPLLRVLMAIEDKGIAINPTRLQTVADYLDVTLADYKLPINPNSYPQLRDYVYGNLGLTPYKYTDSGQPSVDKDVLETLDDPTIKQILQYKELSKERNTYAENYIKRMSPDGRIHPEFKQVSTATGRLSSAKPNLQNVPKEGELRALFVAPEGKSLVRVDYDQLELRVFAAITQEPEMLRAFEQGLDIHQETADATGLPRDKAKNLNFLMLYGGGAWKASQEFKISIDDAKQCIQRYYSKYRGIEKYFHELLAKTHETREVYNYFGRKRRMDALFAEDWRVVKQGERETINTGIQSTAADIVKLAMIDLHYKHHAPMILNVHDELLFEVEEKQAHEYAKWLEEYLPTLIEIEGMRFPVSVKVGKDWKECCED